MTSRPRPASGGAGGAPLTTRSHLGLIAARMEQARWERGISVAELARRVGVDRKRLWRVLNGERAMRADEFVRLCAVLGIGLGSYFTKEMATCPAKAKSGGGGTPRRTR